ncbi:hypothetical protein PGT21_003563 [Puccinia graminis f. sp. tritici]|uniref:Uncharacterized protein n=1 Tax=Puccinia graminis f. sp. tritici TaxID=56615 RepID=A0A5B0LJF4_PUCGR|nr:hypothetical protein PGT21_003563 [Puccinia graminis f. sp. tritici]
MNLIRVSRPTTLACTSLILISSQMKSFHALPMFTPNAHELIPGHGVVPMGFIHNPPSEPGLPLGTVLGVPAIPPPASPVIPTTPVTVSHIISQDGAHVYLTSPVIASPGVGLAHLPPAHPMTLPLQSYPHPATIALQPLTHPEAMALPTYQPAMSFLPHPSAGVPFQPWGSTGVPHHWTEQFASGGCLGTPTDSSWSRRFPGTRRPLSGFNKQDKVKKAGKEESQGENITNLDRSSPSETSPQKAETPSTDQITSSGTSAQEKNPVEVSPPETSPIVRSSASKKTIKRAGRRFRNIRARKLLANSNEHERSRSEYSSHEQGNKSLDRTGSSTSESKEETAVKDELRRDLIPGAIPENGNRAVKNETI